MTDQALKDWNTATGNLPWGTQRVFLETLTAVKDGDIHLVYGADYRDGKPCLVNAVASMLITGGGKGIPSKYFGEVVRAFDDVNANLRRSGVNVDAYVSPLAAEILIRNFGVLKAEPDIDTSVAELSNGSVYVEPSDEELAQDFFDAMKAPAPSDLIIQAESGDPIAQFAKEYVERPSSL